MRGRTSTPFRTLEPSGPTAMSRILLFAPFALLFVLPAGAQPDKKDAPPAYTRKEDVVYGRKFGLALTLDVFTPAKPNGRGVILCVSGGWVSSKEGIMVYFFPSF